MSHKLMIKTHLKTNLKYLCYTTRNGIEFDNYKGSGTEWKKHLKQFGENIKTEIIFQSEDYEEFKQIALQKSIEFDIVDSEKWANLRIESGTGGDTVSGKMWITNEKEDKYILKTEVIPEGWRKGRSNCVFNYTNIGLEYVPKPKEKHNKRLYKEYSVYDATTNTIIKIKNLKQYCIDNNLEYCKMSRLVTNGCNSYKNFKNIKKIDWVSFDDREYNFLLHGEIIRIKNLKQYCIDNGLKMSYMYDLYRGKRKSYFDYTNTNFGGYIPPQNRELKLINDSGEILTINNIKDFCRKNNLNYNSIIALKQKRQKIHKGYKLYE